MKNLIAITIITIVAPVLAWAQGNGRSELQSVKKISLQERKAIAYAPLREADVTYLKRIKRVIDTREKKNLVMNYPKNPFGTILLDLVTQGEDSFSGRVKVYEFDSSRTPLKVGKVKKLTSICETFEKQNPANPNDPYDRIDTTVCIPIDGRDILRYEITEEWIFDKQRGMFFPRIIAIAPLRDLVVNGVPLGEQPLFYVRYDDLREELIHEEMFNRQNSATQLTYYDFFEQRMFSSYITKESNVYDLAIRDMPEFKDDALRAMYKSEEIKQDLFNWEHDLWEY